MGSTRDRAGGKNAALKTKVAERKGSAAPNVGADRQARPGSPARRHSVAMTATQAQNGFGQLLSTVARNGVVTITVRNEKKAVVMSFDDYQALTRGDTPDLAALTAEFDEIARAMQTPAAQAGVDDLFAATPEELARSSHIGAGHQP